MRPHNTGHWTIEGARTSQFEQHLRAVLDLPLGDPAMATPAAAMANVLGGDDADVYDRYIHVMAADPAVKVHMYGKQVRPGRKIGHVTAIGEDPEDLADRPAARPATCAGARRTAIERAPRRRHRDGQRLGLAGDARRGRSPRRVRGPLRG